jgi:hypothetical protein
MTRYMPNGDKEGDLPVRKAEMTHRKYIRTGVRKAGLKPLCQERIYKDSKRDLLIRRAGPNIHGI